MPVPTSEIAEAARKEGFNTAKERAAQVADTAIEAPGAMPEVLYLYPVEAIVRATIRATKTEIATAIRAMKDTFK
jgi:hypothetical protein